MPSYKKKQNKLIEDVKSDYQEPVNHLDSFFNQDTIIIFIFFFQQKIVITITLFHYLKWLISSSWILMEMEKLFLI